MVSAFDSSASWVGESRCEIESSILVIFSTLCHELVSRRTLQCRLRHFTPTYDTTKAMQQQYHLQLSFKYLMLAWSVELNTVEFHMTYVLVVHK